MNSTHEQIPQMGARFGVTACNHPTAILVDPSEQQLRELEAMLAGCPNCGHWTPGDGPIMAIITTGSNRHAEEPTEIF